MPGPFLVSLLMLGGMVPPAAVPREHGGGVAQDASNIEDQFALGVLYNDRGDFDEAIEAFSAVLAQEPELGPALANRAFAYAWTNRLAEATRDVEMAERTRPDAASLHRVRAIIAVRRSDDATAIAEFSRSLEQEPENPLALRFRAALYEQVGNHAAALADANAYIAAHPQDPSGYVQKANLLIQQHQRALADAEAGLLLRLFPDNVEALASAGLIYNVLADRSRAMAAMNEAVARDPGSFNYRHWRAGIRRWDDFTGRRADLDAALELDPGSDRVITELGILDLRERRWADAIARFSTALEGHPRDFGVLAYRAIAHLNAGDRPLAERDFHAASSAASGASDFVSICSTFGRQGLALEWGLEMCNRALQLDGNASDYHADRGLVELRLGRLDAALADYNLAVHADDRGADAYYGRALVFYRRGALREAAADRTQALALNPGIEEAFQEYGFTDFDQARSG